MVVGEPETDGGVGSRCGEIMPWNGFSTIVSLYQAGREMRAIQIDPET
jgi:hypothetical protein